MWRRLVAALAPERLDATLQALDHVGVVPSRVTVLGPGHFYGQLPRGLHVRRGGRVLRRREAMAIGGVAGTLAGAIAVLTVGTLLAHLAASAATLPGHVLPRSLGAQMVSTLWLYGAVTGLLLGAPLGAARGMPQALAARFDESLARGDVLIAVRPPRGAAPRARAALEAAGAHAVRLCYGDLHAAGYADPVRTAPEDDPRYWPG